MQKCMHVTFNHRVGGSSPPEGGRFIVGSEDCTNGNLWGKLLNRKTPKLNLFDSRSKGCVFKSRRGHF